MSQLEIIDTLCSVTTELADLVNRMSVELAQAEIAEEVKEELAEAKRRCDEKLDIIEYNTRRNY